MKKIMLVDPPGFMGNAVGRILGSFGSNKADQAWPPYDLQVFAGYSVINGLDYTILDANNLKLSDSQIEAEIRKYDPDWVIYMTCFPNFVIDAKVALTAKKVNRSIKTACISLSMLSVLDPAEKLGKLTDLDYIIWGEPELPLMQLINGVKPSEVKGLYFRGENGSIEFTGIAPKVANLDALGVPQHSKLNTSLYKCPLSIKKPMTIVNCSRGCINACVHCQAGNFQSPVRYRSIDNVLEELHQIKALGIKEIKFYDCSLPTDREFTKNLCNAMIENSFNFSWNCNARAEMLDDDIIITMKKAGCHTIAIGCESANADLLKNMGKNETPEDIERGVKLVKKHGLRVLMYLTFGLEGETKETMRETYDFAIRMYPDFVTFGIVVPAPGTAFYKKLSKNGQLINKNLEWLDPNALPSFKYPELDPKELHSFTRSAYRRYYFNPGYILRKITRLRSANELLGNIRNASTMMMRYFFERSK